MKELKEIIIPACVSLATAIITIVVSKKIDSLNHTKDEVCRAVDLAGYFEREITPLVSYIAAIFEKVQTDHNKTILEFAENVNFNELNFNDKEIEEFQLKGSSLTAISIKSSFIIVLSS